MSQPQLEKVEPEEQVLFSQQVCDFPSECVTLTHLILDGEIDLPKRNSFLLHAKHCHACHEFFENEKAWRAKFKREIIKVEVPGDLEKTIRGIIKSH